VQTTSVIPVPVRVPADQQVSSQNMQQASTGPGQQSGNQNNQQSNDGDSQQAAIQNNQQRIQNKVIRDIINAPWYVRNENLHWDLKIDFVNKVVNTLLSGESCERRGYPAPQQHG
ncbi:hypothetical protein ACJJTC_019489, partial [Scirpophaga incertulas]